jgi:uncharacterized membrane protein YfcA
MSHIKSLLWEHVPDDGHLDGSEVGGKCGTVFDVVSPEVAMILSNMDLRQVCEICTIVFLGSILQGAVGFGIGLFSIPLLVWFGVPLAATVAIIIVASGLQTAWSWYKTREHMDWRDPIPISAIRLLTLPAGIVVLGILSSHGQSVIKQVVGGVILAILVSQLLFKVRPRNRIATGWMWLAGLVSGFLTGLIGMGGPPLVMWVMAHDWPSHRARAFLWLSFLIATPVMMALLLWRFGSPLILPMLIGMALMPIVLAGAIVGMRVGQLMNRSRLRLAMTVLLIIIAISSMVGA